MANITLALHCTAVAIEAVAHLVRTIPGNEQIQTVGKVTVSC